MKVISTLSVLFFLLRFSTIAQETKPVLISLQLRNVTIEEVAKVIESKSDYFFYYDPDLFDTIRFTISVQLQPLDQILTEAFESTNFYFSIDKKNHVFLTKDVSIKTALPWDRLNQSFPKEGVIINFQDYTRASNDIQLYEIGIKTNEIKQGKANVSGRVYSLKTKTPIPGVIIEVDNNQQSIVTDHSGAFSLDITRGRHTLFLREGDKIRVKRQLMVYSGGNLLIEIEDEIQTLSEVIVSADRGLSVNKPQLGMQKISMKTVKQVPMVFGEADILRVVLTLPGVKSVGEASTGFNVRGGATDQNLILFNDATIYNPSHFFGFFSAFNPEVVKDVELYKSSIPANYGGRVSSVLNIIGKEGNKKEFSGSAGIGMLTSRMNMEGPIKKDKSSFVLGGRTTYSNWLLKLLPGNSDYKDSKASFYDLNLGIAHDVDAHNQILFTGYFSKDRFNLNTDTVYGYSNRNFSLKWKHIFSQKFKSNFIVGHDQYEYRIGSDENPVNAYKMSFDIGQFNLKAEFQHAIGKKHEVGFGFSSVYYKLHPGSFLPDGNQSLVVPKIIKAEQGLESAVYLGDQFDVNPKLSFYAGLRYSTFQYLGEQEVRIYAAGLPKDENTRLATVNYNKGKVIKSYQGPEVRFSMKYSIGENFSLKAGYNTLRQYIHMLSNTTAISPTDIWKLSDPNIMPQEGDQLAFGLYKNTRGDSLEFSIEGYYKRLKNYLDYVSGAILVLNDHIETDVLNTQGKAYGIEFLIKKKYGKLNGWLSYTYSRTFLKMDDPTAGNLINGGEYYPANYDKPHDVTLIGNYRINERFSLSLNMTYSTGRPITLPIGRYWYGGSQRALYSDRNAYRIPDYFRTDLSMNIEGNHKIKQRTHNSWTIGVYNLTGRKNPYSVYFVSENGVVNGYKLSIFGSIIPFINYNIRF